MNPADWIQNTREYFTEVQAEYKKITWPAQSEAVNGTVGVVVVVAVVTLVLGLVDYALSQFTSYLIQ